MMFFFFLLLLLVIIIIILAVGLLIIKRKTPHEYFYEKKYYDVRYKEEEPTQEQLIFFKDVTLIFLVAVYNIDLEMLRKRISYLVRGAKNWYLFLYGLDSTNQNTIKQLYVWKQECPEHVLL